MPAAYHDLPPEYFPLTVSLLHCVTREVLWHRRVERPSSGEKVPVRIPGRIELGVPVIARVEFANGLVQEMEPPGSATAV